MEKEKTIQDNAYITEERIVRTVGKGIDPKVLEKINERLAKVDELVSITAEIRELLRVQKSTEGSYLTETDQQIVELVKKKGEVCAEDVQTELNYKGKNGASSRLNRLARDGIIQKRRVGKTVFFHA